MSGRRHLVEGKAGAIRPGRILLALCVASVALLAVASSAGATQYQRPLIGTFGAAEEPEFATIGAMAVDQSTDDLLVGDGGANEEQAVTVSATEGTFKLSLEGHTTVDIPFDAGWEAVQEALDIALTGSASNRVVSVGGGPGDAAGSKPYSIIFNNGGYEERDVEQLTCVNGSTPLSGGSGCSVATLTDGREPGVYRYGPDGTPAPFGALGSNLMNGKSGPGGKPCAEEPASCDQTPQNGMKFSASSRAFGQEIAIDPTNGDIYIAMQSQEVVDIFSPEGRYLGQFTAAGPKTWRWPTGVTVDAQGAVFVFTSEGVSKFVPTNPPNNSDFITTFKLPHYNYHSMVAAGTGGSAGSVFVVTHADEGNGEGPEGAPWVTWKLNTETGVVQTFVEGYNEAVTVDPTSGNPLIERSPPSAARNGYVELAEFDGSLETTESVLSRTIIEKSIGEAYEYTVSPSGDLYVGLNNIGGHYQHAKVFVYGHPAVVPTVTLEPITGLTSSEVTLNGTVAAEGIEIDECFFEWGKGESWNHKTPCEGSLPPTDSSPHHVQVSLTGLEPNGVKYHFRLAAHNENGTERTRTESFSTASTVVSEPATVTGKDTATLHGVLRPEGSQYTECIFEWGLASHAGYEHTAQCDPEAADIPADHGLHPVTALLTGLSEQTRYRFRLKATDGEGTLEGAEENFETFGPPQVTALRASDAGQSAVTLEAEVDPSGFETSYWFEWGPTEGYGHMAPVSPGSIDAGETPVRVTAEIGELSTATVYHYRVVAESTAGTKESPDQRFETLDGCGLPDGRCLELSSPREMGPIAAPGRQLAQFELNSQAGTQPGAVAYTVEAGMTGATRGTQVLYLAGRGGAGWSSEQLSPPTTAPNQLSEAANPSQYFGLSPDLSCGVLASNQPLTGDPQARLVVEAGGGNLYRHNPDGSYTLITNLAPENTKGAGRFTSNYTVDVISRHCGRVVFESRFSYPGVPATGLYEWHEGTLGAIGMVPNGSGEEAIGGEAHGGTAGNHVNILSEDGSRLFFSAKRLTGKVAGETGTTGVFVREGGHSYDLSASETGKPDEGAMYVGATPDGSRVYFTANAGLTTHTSESGTDLYEYDFEKPEAERLEDLSAEPAGTAGVHGLVGFAEDGSHVYFAARAQLLPGQGPTTTENEASGGYSIYDSHEGALYYVGALGSETGKEGATTVEQAKWTSRTSPDGRYLLFESTVKVTGYETHGGSEAYLYDAEAPAGSPATVCISCRQDGAAPVLPTKGQAKSGGSALANGGQSAPLVLRNSLVVRDGRPVVIFCSYDSLAPGAASEEFSLYEWAHGQVFLLAAQSSAVGPAGIGVKFIGASEDGTDLYFFDAAALNWENPLERYATWDARIGGGFPEPAPSESCDPDSEGSCQGSSSAAPAAPSVGTATHSGSGNEKSQNGKKKKHHKKQKKTKHHKKQQHKKKKNSQNKKKQKRHARRDGRAGK